MALGSSLKSVRGVVRVSPTNFPSTRAVTGVAAMKHVSGLAYEVLAVATLNASNHREGELIVMTVTAEDVSPMIIGNRSFSLLNESLHGIAKVIWAGVSVICLMTSTGEFLCMRSGLQERPDANDDECSSSCSCPEDVGNEPIIRSAIHAVDVCAITVDGCPVVVVAGHVQMHGYIFPKLCTKPEEKTELRGLAAGAFQAVAAVPGDPDNPAMLAGCTSGCVTLFEWRDSALNPVVVRTILMGVPTQFFGIAVGCPFGDELAKGRIITFCVLGKAETEAEFLTPLNADGYPFEVAETFHTTPEPFPSWNEVCCKAAPRLHTDGSSLWVMRPQIHPDNVALNALIITFTQHRSYSPPLHAAGAIISDEVNPSSSPLQSSSLSSSSILRINVRVVDVSSLDCKRAFAKLTPAVSLIPILRYANTEGKHVCAEFCLFDGRHAIFFGSIDESHLEPRSVVQLHDGEDHLVGITWSPSSKRVMVLSGSFLNAGEGSCDVGNNVDHVLPAIVGNLVLSVRETKPWLRQDTSGSLTAVDVREIVRTVVQTENEKLFRRLEERIDALESAVLMLSRQGSSGRMAECDTK